MFFRVRALKKGTSLQLIESYRTDAGLPRQKVLLSLSNVDIPKEYWSAICDYIEAHFSCKKVEKKQTLVEARFWGEKILRQLKQKNTKPQENSPALIKKTELGPLILLKQGWKDTGLKHLLWQLGFTKSQIQDAWITLANRLLAGCHENRLTDWVRQTAIPEILGRSPEKFSKDRFYRILKKLKQNKGPIEAHLKQLATQHKSIYPWSTIFDFSHVDFLQSWTQRFFVSVFDEQGFMLQHTEQDRLGDLDIVKMIETWKRAQQTQEKQPFLIFDGDRCSKDLLDSLEKMQLCCCLKWKKTSNPTQEWENFSSFQGKYCRVYHKTTGNDTTLYFYRDGSYEKWIIKHYSFGLKQISDFFETWKLIDRELEFLKKINLMTHIFDNSHEDIDADILVNIMAYQLLHWIEYKLLENKMSLSWSDIIEILKSHVYKTVKIGDTISSFSTDPNREQKRIYKIFNIDCKSALNKFQ